MTSDNTDYKGTILIVDDIPNNVLLLSELLDSSGYEIQSVMDGKTAIEIASNYLPDLILLDIMMPKMDGFQVCSELKKIELTKDIPIIFLSALHEVVDKVKAFELGGVDYITKPFQVKEVIARVETQLTIQRQKYKLKQEIISRQQAELELQKNNLILEEKVKQRTKDLANSLSQLQIEIEQRKLAQAQVQQSFQLQKQINELKTQMIKNISHEFRTPIFIISLAVEALENNYHKMNHDKRHKKFTEIKQNIQRLVEMMDDALNFNQLEIGEFQSEPQSLDLNNLITKLITEWQNKIDNKHTIKYTADHLPTLLLDPQLIKLVINHLLSNAIRYSPDGGLIQINLTIQTKHLIIQIQDQGIGIPPSEKDKIFEAFYRASNADSIPGTPGKGLGLAIVTKIMQLKGGNISVDSIINQGTTFTLSFPIQN